MQLTINWDQWKRLEKKLRQAEKLGVDKAAIKSATRYAADRAKTKMARALVSQTGLPYRTQTKALRPSSEGDMGAKITTKGADARASKFRPKQTAAGVVAHPWNRATTYHGAFTKGGKKRNKPLGKGVLRRVGKSRLPLEQVHTGLVLPLETLKGQSGQAFEQTVKEVLPRRLEQQLGYWIKKALT